MASDDTSGLRHSEDPDGRYLESSELDGVRHFFNPRSMTAAEIAHVLIDRYNKRFSQITGPSLDADEDRPEK